MELEELIHMLNRAADKDIIQSPRFSLRDHPTYDPFRQIKKRCYWIFLFFAATTVIFFPFLLGKGNTLAVLLYLTLSVEPVISLIAWLQIRSLEHADGNMKQNLLLRIRSLQSIFRSYIFLNAFFYILLASTLEYLIIKKAVDNPETEKFPISLRLLFYLLFIAFQYWQKRKSYLKNYGDYLSSMTRLLNQTHED